MSKPKQGIVEKNRVRALARKELAVQNICSQLKAIGFNKGKMKDHRFDHNAEEFRNMFEGFFAGMDV